MSKEFAEDWISRFSATRGWRIEELAEDIAQARAIPEAPEVTPGREIIEAIRPADAEVEIIGIVPPVISGQKETVSLPDGGKLYWYGNKVFTLATKANMAAMCKAALLVEKDTKEHFTKQGQGRIYGKRKHRASRPGDPPAIDTGTLRASIMSEVKQSGLGVEGRVGPDIEHIAAKASIGTNVEYGYYLELGTSKMAPRPFLRPALIRTRKQVVKIFKEANS